MRIVVAFGALAMIASSQIVVAQSAAMTGVVSDARGQVFSGVTVTATPESAAFQGIQKLAATGRIDPRDCLMTRIVSISSFALSM